MHSGHYLKSLNNDSRRVLGIYGSMHQDHYYTNTYGTLSHEVAATMVNKYAVRSTNSPIGRLLRCPKRGMLTRYGSYRQNKIIGADQNSICCLAGRHKFVNARGRKPRTQIAWSTDHSEKYLKS